MWCQERRPTIGAKVANAFGDLESGDAKRDFDAAPIEGARLGLHFAKAIQIADGSLCLDLSYGMEGTVQPPPFALDLTLKGQQFVQRIRDSVMRFHSCLACPWRR
jgi:hypothetical protein